MLLAAAISTASADLINVPYLHFGGFFGPPMPPAAPAMPDNDPVFQDYFAGQTVLPGVFTDLVVGGVPTSFPPVTLEIETAPIPAPGAAVVLGLAALSRRRR